MALTPYHSAAFTSTSGVAVAAGADVEVRREDTGALASIYADRDSVTPLSNPFNADSDGRFTFYAAGLADGYRVKVTADGEEHTLRYVPIGSAQYLDGPLDITDASQIVFTPAGAIAATDVQAAIEELDSEKVDSASLLASEGADLVGFIASGAGAVQRTMLEKARDFLSVQDFDAVGDGSTDDAAAFTAAEAIGKLIWVPKTASGYAIDSAVGTDDAAWFIDPTLTWAQFSDSGNLDIVRGFYTGTGDGANIWRFADRVFIGEAAAEMAGTFSPGGGGDSWAATEVLEFTSGGTYEVVAGNTVTGATSAATGIVVAVTLVSGSWAAGTAAGTLLIKRRTGAFQAENLNVGANSNVATIAAGSIESYAGYVVRAAQAVITTTPTPIGGVLGLGIGARSSDGNGTALGWGVILDNDESSGNAWGGIIEAVRRSGAGFTAGLEIDVKNQGTDTTTTPYTRSQGTFGLWLVAGGDELFADMATADSDTAMVIVTNPDSGFAWNQGIVVEATALAGCDGVTGTANAVVLARGHDILWQYAGGNVGARIRSNVDAAGSFTTMVFDDKLVRFQNDDGARYFQASYVDNSVNFAHAIGSVTGTGPSITSAGSDTDIDLIIDAQGTGKVNITAPIVALASSTAAATLRIPHGTAPSSPVNGDIWTTTAGIFVRINGATVGPLS